MYDYQQFAPHLVWSDVEMRYMYITVLSDCDAEKYVDGEDEVIDFETIINEVALLRNKYLGILKGLESKNFMQGHLVRLKTAGMEDYAV